MHNVLLILSEVWFSKVSRTWLPTPLLVVLSVVQELLTHRTWDVSRHPQWLVFEAEGRLQIRPAQHTLAMTLLEGEAEDRGPIAQLNMGEGKTRVILPMMILELADGRNLVSTQHTR